MPGIMSQTRAVEASVQAISPDWYCEPISGAAGSVVFMFCCADDFFMCVALSTRERRSREE